MKKILTILSILGCSFFASAQCEVLISMDSTTTGLVLTANTINNMAVAFEWNTGETTQSINADPGSFDYCVTAIFANGCIATACFGNGGGGNDCSVGIQVIQGGSWVQATATGEAPYTYEWSNGQTDAAIPIGANDSLLCVVITDATGCTANSCIEFWDDCFVSIYEEMTPIGGSGLFAEATGTPPYTYLWNNGETSESIFPNSFGTYCVEVTDATGCVTNGCYEYMGSGNNCSVFIYGDSTQVGATDLVLTAEGTGANPFTFVWSTGENSQEIMVSETGTYCVTLTDATGCSATECFYYESIECGGEIDVDGNNIDGFNLCAQPFGQAPFTYTWNTGETTDCIFIDETGTYSVTIVDANGCVSEVCCLTFVMLEESFELRGLVYPADTINLIGTYEGWAYRIGMNPGGTASLIDSVALESSPNGVWYDFGEVDAGEYLVKVALTENSTGYDINMPTYHYSHLTWSEADVITVPSLGFNSYDVVMIYGDNPGGPGGIYGSVIVGDGLVLDPIPNTYILLYNESGEPVAFDVTNENGEFSFPDLAWGTYQVWIDIPGQEAAWYWVTIGPDNPTATDLIFEVSETGISTNINEVLAVETFNTFPNPVDNYLMIQFNAIKAADVQISLVSITGQTLLVDNQYLTAGGQNIEIEVAKIPTGVYFVNIANGKDVISQKIVIK
jgi:hypothetical protein